jgi:pantetheine-phosphate adenylyltransferase
MKTCIYPGSFDPCTLGHVDIIRRASNVFDRVCVAIGNNPSKKYTFSTIERKELLEKALSKFPNVYVSIFDGLLADFAYEQNHKLNSRRSGNCRPITGNARRNRRG